MAKSRKALKRAVATTSENRGRVVALVPATMAERDSVRAHPQLTSEVRQGTLSHLARDGHAWVEVDVDGRHYCLKALAVVDLATTDVGEQVVVLESGSGPGVVLGRLKVPRALLPAVEASVDRRRLVLGATDEVVIRCGRASLTLRRDGRVQLKGSYVETHAEGVNRIKGGSVQIN